MNSAFLSVCVGLLNFDFLLFVKVNLGSIRYIIINLPNLADNSVS
jgi:hypothetical protein